MLPNPLGPGWLETLFAPGSAADVSQLAADMVLRGDALLPVGEAVAVARKARRLVLENFALAGLYNLVAIPVAALGLVTL